MSIAQTKARLRAGLIELGCDPPIVSTPPGVGLIFPIADMFAEELGNIDEEPPVIAMWDPRGAVPTAPATGDRYIATHTGNGWESDNIYEWTGDVWSTITYRVGRLVYVINEDNWYGAYGIGWSPLAASGITEHGHVIGDITDLQSILDGKAPIVHYHDDVYSLLGHGHAISDVTDLTSTLAGKSDTSHLHDGRYSLLGHGHAISDVTDLTSTLAGKSDTSHLHDGRYSQLGHGHAISDVTNLQSNLDAKVDKVTSLGAVDANTLTTSGNYRITGSTNTPATNATAWLITVSAVSDTVLQFARYYSATNSNRVYYRSRNNAGTWEAWTLLPNAADRTRWDDKVSRAGDSMYGDLIMTERKGIEFKDLQSWGSRQSGRIWTGEGNCGRALFIVESNDEMNIACNTYGYFHNGSGCSLEFGHDGSLFARLRGDSGASVTCRSNLLELSGSTIRLWSNNIGAGVLKTTGVYYRDVSTITGTASDYIRGDGVAATLNKAAVGLGNVDNTSDANKPISGDITGTLGATSVWRVRQRDTRSENPAPGGMLAGQSVKHYAQPGLYADFKINSIDGLSDGGVYHGVVTYKRWTDESTGGHSHQIGLTDNNNMWIRSGLSAWGGWSRLAKASELPTSLPPSGTAGGDLRGAYPNPNVNQVRPNALSGANVHDVIYGQMADNDYYRIRAGGTANDAGYLEIATADNGTEPIYVRQYTGVFTSLTRTAELLGGDGHTRFPGYVFGQYFNNSHGIETTPAVNAADTIDSIYVGKGDGYLRRTAKPQVRRTLFANNISSPSYLAVIGDNWGDAGSGYVTMSQLKTAIGVDTKVSKSGDTLTGLLSFNNTNYNIGMIYSNSLGIKSGDNATLEAATGAWVTGNGVSLTATVDVKINAPTLYTSGNNYLGETNAHNTFVSGNLNVRDSGNTWRLVIENDDYSWRGRLNPGTAGFVKTDAAGNVSKDTNSYVVATNDIAATVPPFNIVVTNSGSSRYGRSGRFGYLSLAGVCLSRNMAPWETLLITTLPVGCRPPAVVSTIGIAHNVPFRVDVSSNGSVNIVNTSNVALLTNGPFDVSLTFLVS